MPLFTELTYKLYKAIGNWDLFQAWNMSQMGPLAGRLGRVSSSRKENCHMFVISQTWLWLAIHVSRLRLRSF